MPEEKVLFSDFRLDFRLYLCLQIVFEAVAFRLQIIDATGEVAPALEVESVGQLVLTVFVERSTLATVEIVVGIQFMDMDIEKHAYQQMKLVVGFLVGIHLRFPLYESRRNLTYKGLSTLPWIRDHFKSVQITHGYKSVFSVGSYNSYASWVQVMDGSDLGFISNTTGDMYSPGSCYDVSTVSINESFCPLAGLNLTFMNNMTLKTEYRTTRVLALSMTNAQITETVSNDFVLGWGYKLNDFRLSSIFGFSKASKKAAMRTTARNRAQKGNTNNNDNDLNIRKNRNAFAHTLNLRFDLSIRNQAAIRRDIQTGQSEATSGNKAVKTAFQLDYAMSKYVTMTMFYDRQSTSPLLSSSSYPTVTQDFGFTMKFNLTR